MKNPWYKSIVMWALLIVICTLPGLWAQNELNDDLDEFYVDDEISVVLDEYFELFENRMYPAALYNLQEFIQTVDTTDIRKMAFLYPFLSHAASSVYYQSNELDDLKQAIEICQISARYNEMLDRGAELEEEYSGLCIMYMTLNYYEYSPQNIELALDAGLKARKYMPFCRGIFDSTMALKSIAKSAVEMANLEKNEQYTQLALDCLSEIDLEAYNREYPQFTGNVTLEMAESYARLGELLSNQDYYQTALKLINRSMATYSFYKQSMEYLGMLVARGRIYSGMSAVADERQNLLKAEQDFLEALSICESLGYWESHAQLNSFLGYIYQQLCRVDDSPDYTKKSIKCYNESLSSTVWPNSEQVTSHIRASQALNYMDLAAHEEPEKNFMTALEFLEAAGKVMTETDYPMEYTEIQLSLGRLYTEYAAYADHDSCFALAEQAFKRGLKHISGDDSPQNYAYANYLFGHYYLVLGKYENPDRNFYKAENLYRESIQYYSKINDRGDAAGAWLEISEINFRHAMNKKVQYYLNKVRQNLQSAEVIAADLDNPVKKTDILVSYITYWSGVQRYVEPDSSFREILTLCDQAQANFLEDADTIKLSYIKSYFGSAFWKRATIRDTLENARLALDYYQECYDLLRNCKIEFLVAAANENIAESYRLMSLVENPRENLAKAREYFDMAADKFPKFGVPDDHITFFLNIGEYYTQLSELENRDENLETAYKYFARASGLIDKFEQPIPYADFLICLGQTDLSRAKAYGDKKDIRNALRCFRRAKYYYEINGCDLTAQTAVRFLDEAKAIIEED